MRIDTETTEEAILVHPVGRIDSANAADFHLELQKATSSPTPSLVVLNCLRLTYISSAGLRALLLMKRQLGLQARDMVACHLSEQIAEVFTLSGFERIIHIYGTEAQALHNIDHHPTRSQVTSEI